MKRPLIYLGIAVLVALAIFLLEGPEGARLTDSSAEGLIPGFDSAKVSQIEIEQLLDGANLRREGEMWQVADRISRAKGDMLKGEERSGPEPKWWVADRARVASALGTFGGLEQGVLVSDNPQKQSLYQADDATGLKVRALGPEGALIVDVVIGTGGPDFDSTYVRRAGENRVYLVRRSLVGVFSPRAKDWRERKLWSLEPSEIQEAELSSSEGGWKISKGDGEKWHGSSHDGKPIDDEKAQAIIKKLAHVSAVDFADDATEESAGLDRPAAVLSFKYGKDKGMELTVGKEIEPAGDKDKSAGRYHAKLSGSDEIYILSKDVVEALKPSTH